MSEKKIVYEIGIFGIPEDLDQFIEELQNTKENHPECHKFEITFEDRGHCGDIDYYFTIEGHYELD